MKRETLSDEVEVAILNDRTMALAFSAYSAASTARRRIEDGRDPILVINVLCERLEAIGEDRKAEIEKSLKAKPKARKR